MSLDTHSFWLTLLAIAFQDNHLRLITTRTHVDQRIVYPKRLQRSIPFTYSDCDVIRGSDFIEQAVQRLRITTRLPQWRSASGAETLTRAWPMAANKAEGSYASNLTPVPVVGSSIWESTAVTRPAEMPRFILDLCRPQASERSKSACSHKNKYLFRLPFLDLTQTKSEDFRQSVGLMDQVSKAKQEVPGAISDVQIAALRAFLAAVALLAIYFDPTEPNRFVPLTYASLILYTLYSASIYCLARHVQAFSMSFTALLVWTDVFLYSLLVSLSSGTNSIFFFWYFFVIVVACSRLGADTGVAVNGSLDSPLCAAWIFRYAIGPRRNGTGCSCAPRAWSSSDIT